MAITTFGRGIQTPLGFNFGTEVAPIDFLPVSEFKAFEVTDNKVYLAIYTDAGTPSAKLAKTLMTIDGNGKSYSYFLDISDTDDWPIGSYTVQFSFDTATGQNVIADRAKMGIHSQIPAPLVTDTDIGQLIYDANEYLGDRADWSFIIAEAWNSTFWKLARLKRPNGTNLDPYTIADSTELYQLHLFKTIHYMAMELRSRDSDRFGLMAEDYAGKFDEEFEAISQSQLELWTAGPGASAETIEENQIRGQYKRYGDDGSSTSTDNRRVDATPSYGRDTEW